MRRQDGRKPFFFFFFNSIYFFTFFISSSCDLLLKKKIQYSLNHSILHSRAEHTPQWFSHCLAVYPVAYSSTSKVDSGILASLPSFRVFPLPGIRSLVLF